MSKFSAILEKIAIVGLIGTLILAFAVEFAQAIMGSC